MRVNLRLLTGWGGTCKTWSPIIPALEQCYQVYCFDPPWVKQNQPKASLGELENLVDSLASCLKNQKTQLVAWSLGGLIAIHLANKYPHLVEQIIFIASAPQFMATENFPHAIDQAWFENFIIGFEDNPRATLNKFIALQAKGDEYQMNTRRFLKNHINLERLDLKESLLGLRLLQQQRLMSELQNLKCKSTFIHGENDAVLSFKAAQQAAISINSKIEIIENAGHAPHISHPELTVSLIERFLNDENF